MLFVLLAVAGGLAAGSLLGGSLRRLEATRLQRVWTLMTAVVLQLVGAFTVSGAAYAGVLVASLVLALAFLAANRTLAGRGLIGLGLGLNALVIVANGAMPVSLAAAARAGVPTRPLADDPRHAVADAETNLAVLDDRIGLPLPWQPQVLSAGDVLVAAGAALMVTQAMRRRIGALPPLRPGRPPRPDWPPPQAAGRAPRSSQAKSV